MNSVGEFLGNHNVMSDIADIDIRGKPIFGLTDRCEYIHNNIMVGGGWS